MHQWNPPKNENIFFVNNFCHFVYNEKWYKKSPKENQLTIRTISDYRITTSTKYKKNVPLWSIIYTSNKTTNFSLFSHLILKRLFFSPQLKQIFFFSQKISIVDSVLFFVSPTNKTRVFAYFFWRQIFS